MNRYTILQVSPEAYADIRRRIVAVDEKIGQDVYQRELIRPAFRSHPERLALDGIHLEALPPAAPDVQAALRVIRESLSTPEAESAFYALEALLPS